MTTRDHQFGSQRPQHWALQRCFALLAVAFDQCAAAGSVEPYNFASVEPGSYCVFVCALVGGDCADGGTSGGYRHPGRLRKLVANVLRACSRLCVTQIGPQVPSLSLHYCSTLW
eukprot:TRINITY_DN61118_c0_g1_i1.p2 TRINITY_DN61118_c0_g1~~TRINITY_DN61118_c0_g1_i1.p2  ORF type:complete len:114 (-),score=5.46 TRINITY_DN61118_c0_g1_i1:54-395(-)